MNPEISNFLLLAHPLINVLVIIYQALSLVHIPFALGFTIIVLTILIRLVLYPLTATQLRATKKMQDLAPHIAKLKEKHKGDAKMLMQEQNKLFKEHGVSQLAGCLPLLIQLPLIFSLYQVLNDVVKYNTTQINHVLYSFVPKLSKPWDVTFFGLPLGQNPSHLYSTIGPAILLVPIITGLLQFVQSKMMLPQAPQASDKKLASAKSGSGEKKEDFAASFQSQSTYILPVMIGIFSWGFPIGLSLYWNTFTIFGIIQQYKITGLGGLKVWIDKLNGRKK